MAITFRYLAHRQNLSLDTVSRALDGFSVVAESIRQSVVQAAQETGCYLASAARQLRRKRSDAIGYTLPTSSPLFFDPLSIFWVRLRRTNYLNHQNRVNDKVMKKMLDISRVTRSHVQARSSYDRLSRWYDLTEGGSENRPRRLGLELLQIKPGEKMLEIGVGKGSSLLELPDQVRAIGKMDQNTILLTSCCL